MSLIVRVIQGVSLLVILWTAYIWVYALMYGRRLTHRAATITITMPIGIQLLRWGALQVFYSPMWVSWDDLDYYIDQLHSSVCS